LDISMSHLIISPPACFTENAPEPLDKILLANPFKRVYKRVKHLVG
jgi:hypothetical protein